MTTTPPARSPPAAPPAVSGADEPRTRAVCVIVLNVHAPSSALVALLVGEPNRSAGVSSTGAEPGLPWTAPMGSRRNEPVAEQARNELDEELHLQVEAAQLRDGARFASERVAVGNYVQAVFVARRPFETGCAGFTQRQFLERRERCRSELCGPCFFETTSMAAVPVASLLADATLETSCARDVDGVELALRGEFALMLRHEGVRARLSEALEAFEAAREPADRER